MVVVVGAAVDLTVGGVCRAAWPPDPPNKPQPDTPTLSASATTRRTRSRDRTTQVRSVRPDPPAKGPLSRLTPATARMARLRQGIRVQAAVQVIVVGAQVQETMTCVVEHDYRFGPLLLVLEGLN